MPSTEGGVPDVVGSFMFLTFLLQYERTNPLSDFASLYPITIDLKSGTTQQDHDPIAEITVSWISFLQSFVRKDRAQGIVDLRKSCACGRGPITCSLSSDRLRDQRRCLPWNSPRPPILKMLPALPILKMLPLLPMLRMLPELPMLKRLPTLPMLRILPALRRLRMLRKLRML